MLACSALRYFSPTVQTSQRDVPPTDAISAPAFTRNVVAGNLRPLPSVAEIWGFLPAAARVKDL